MPYIVWRSSYELGFKEIDEQHQRLIEIINELYEAQQQGTGRTLVRDSIVKLIEYSVYHFDNEQKLFEQYSYPAADEHIKEHKGFIEKAESLKTEIGNNNILVTLKTLDFLKDWTINHILGTDKDFSEFVREVETGN